MCNDHADVSLLVPLEREEGKVKKLSLFSAYQSFLHRISFIDHPLVWLHTDFVRDPFYPQSDFSHITTKQIIKQYTIFQGDQYDPDLKEPKGFNETKSLSNNI